MASEIKVDTISEKTSTNGVTIDSVSLKDGKVATANSIDSDAYVDGSIDNAHIADDAIDSEHYADGSIDNAHIADDAIDSEHYAAGSIDTAHIADNQITLAKMAGGTDGNVISYDASGDPVAITTGSDGQVLTSTGAGSPPAFEDAGGGAHSLLQTQNASDSASISFSSTYITSSYRDYMVIVSGMIPASEGYKLKLYISSDNGSSYKSGSGYDYGTRGFHSAGGTAHTAEQNATGGFQIQDDTTPNDSTKSVSFVMNIFNPLSTAFAFSYYCNGTLVSTDDNGHLFHSGGYYDADYTTAFNNIKFQMSSGNITSGQFRLYGIT